MGLYQSNKGNNLGVNHLRNQREIFGTQMKTLYIKEIIKFRNVLDNLIISQLEEQVT